MITLEDEVSFSDLKLFALSPAHFEHAVTYPRARNVTRAMRMGTLVDMLLLTKREPIVSSVGRNTSAYKALRARIDPDVEIFSEGEYESAVAIVATVMRDPVARDYLGADDPERRTQVPLKWELQGVRRRTRGVDVVTRRRLVDLKVTATAQPERLMSHARRMAWHAQLADYAEACRQNRIDIGEGAFLVGVEARPPHCTTVLRMTDDAITEGEKLLTLWIESFKACASAGVWPSYAQGPVDFDILGAVGLEELVFPEEEGDADAS